MIQYKQSVPTQIQISNSKPNTPVSNGAINNPSQKIAIIPNKPKYPKMHSLFLFGFVGTLLVGPFHYGYLLFVSLGFGLPVYGTCLNLYTSMYKWNNKQIGKVLILI